MSASGSGHVRSNLPGLRVAPPAHVDDTSSGSESPTARHLHRARKRQRRAERRAAREYQGLNLSNGPPPEPPDETSEPEPELEPTEGGLARAIKRLRRRTMFLNGCTPLQMVLEEQFTPNHDQNFYYMYGKLQRRSIEDSVSKDAEAMTCVSKSERLWLRESKGEYIASERRTLALLDKQLMQRIQKLKPKQRDTITSKPWLTSELLRFRKDRHRIARRDEQLEKEDHHNRREFSNAVISPDDAQTPLENKADDHLADRPEPRRREESSWGYYTSTAQPCIDDPGEQTCDASEDTEEDEVDYYDDCWPDYAEGYSDAEMYDSPTDHENHRSVQTITKRRFGSEEARTRKERLTFNELQSKIDPDTGEEKSYEDQCMEPEWPRHAGRYKKRNKEWRISLPNPYFTHGGETWKRMTATKEAALDAWNKFNKRAMGPYEFNHADTYKHNRMHAQIIDGKDVNWRFALQQDSLTRDFPDTSILENKDTSGQVRKLTFIIHRLNFPLRNTLITADFGDEHMRRTQEFMKCKLFNIRQQYIRRQRTIPKDYETASDIRFNPGTPTGELNADGSCKLKPMMETQRCFQCGVGNNLVLLRPCTRCENTLTTFESVKTNTKFDSSGLVTSFRPVFCGINCQEIFRETVHAIPQGSCHSMIAKKRPDNSNCFIYPGCDNQSDPMLYYEGASLHKQYLRGSHIGRKETSNSLIYLEEKDYPAQ